MKTRTLGNNGFSVSAIGFGAMVLSPGRSPSQVALNWVRHKGTIPIVGARKLEHIKDNHYCLEFDLSEEHLI